ncbi:hypothetical protein COLO4_37925 [Corchorus olitorius]|uniref:Uncharacterized protein n=1 Tax=Corchorus olitorius TaxID=93759 RepID=A0A1R3FXW7_9ROSI|nr:hypothetical protein COLO4_37925 [Corchorus olitorius]
MSTPNSPDLNILDLEFFYAIQLIQHTEAPKNVDELVSAVERSFEVYPSKDSNKIFLTLQTCMEAIMKEKGSNIYKIPHSRKAILERAGRLPTLMKCDPNVEKEVDEYLHHNRAISEAVSEG